MCVRRRRRIAGDNPSLLAVYVRPAGTERVHGGDHTIAGVTGAPPSSRTLSGPVLPPPFTPPAKTMNGFTLAAIRVRTELSRVDCALGLFSSPRWLEVGDSPRYKGMSTSSFAPVAKTDKVLLQADRALVCVRGCLRECVELSRRVSWGSD